MKIDWNAFAALKALGIDTPTAFIGSEICPCSKFATIIASMLALGLVILAGFMVSPVFLVIGLGLPAVFAYLINKMPDADGPRIKKPLTPARRRAIAEQHKRKGTYTGHYDHRPSSKH